MSSCCPARRSRPPRCLRLSTHICRDLLFHGISASDGFHRGEPGIGFSRQVFSRILTDLDVVSVGRYCGIPFQNAYPPLLHMLVAGTAWLFNISCPALAHHIVGASFYCLGPVALMFLAYALSNDLTLSFVSALAASLLSLTTFLILRAGGHWDPRGTRAGQDSGPLRRWSARFFHYACADRASGAAPGDRTRRRSADTRCRGCGCGSGVDQLAGRFFFGDRMRVLSAGAPGPGFQSYPRWPIRPASD